MAARVSQQDSQIALFLFFHLVSFFPVFFD